jgi:hypothetical protein
MRFDLKALFDGVVGIILVSVLLLLGALFGLSFAVLLIPEQAARYSEKMAPPCSD